MSLWTNYGIYTHYHTAMHIHIYVLECVCLRVTLRPATAAITRVRLHFRLRKCAFKSRCLLLAFEFLPIGNVSLKYTFSLVLLHCFLCISPKWFNRLFSCISSESLQFSARCRHNRTSNYQSVTQSESQSASQPVSQQDSVKSSSGSELVCQLQQIDR